MSATVEVTRRSADFPQGLCVDTYISDELLNVKIDHQKLSELKDEIKRMVTAPFEKPSEVLQLIDDIQRLGVAYHLQNEIALVLQQIHEIFSNNSAHDDDLNTAALRFRLLRQQGHRVSCDMFNKFKDVDGKFSQSHADDVLGLLSLYEASMLRIHDEEILDEAVIFTTTHLELALKGGLLPPMISKQVSHALYQPMWKGYHKMEVRHYLSIYGEYESHNKVLLKFAKLFQLCATSLSERNSSYCEFFSKFSLNCVIRWWNDMDFVSKLPFARHRIIEAFFWSVGICYLPEQHLSRMMLCKVISMITVIDDIYDVYCEYTELEKFTEATKRWDASAMDTLPEYMKVCYQGMLDLFVEFDEILAKQGNSYRSPYGRDAMKVLITAYLREATWYKNNYTPTLDEYLTAALSTSNFIFVAISFVGMVGEVTKEQLDWTFTDPKMVKASNVIGRLLDDKASHEFEQKRGHVASAVECYMKEHGTTTEETLIEFRVKVNNAWKDINEELLQPTILPVHLLTVILDMSREIEAIYKYADGYTESRVVLKNHIESLLLKPVPI